MKNKLSVIALGGSIMYPDQIDTEYLKSFKKFIERLVNRGHKFIIVAGGGKLARNCQKALSEVIKADNWDKDIVGIQATKVNAYLLQRIFKRISDPVIIDNRYKIKKLKYPITISSGWVPGHSTDHDAIALALDFKADQVIIAGKPSHVYDKNPDHHEDANPFDKISWSDYRKMFPKKWQPGFGSPVDPIGAKLAHERGLKALILNGRDLKNFEKAILGKDFVGTVIS